jgi:NDP-sugar pyrophosphorylase family protein
MFLTVGPGTRLQEETEFKPKPMVKVGGKNNTYQLVHSGSTPDSFPEA